MLVMHTCEIYKSGNCERGPRAYQKPQSGTQSRERNASRAKHVRHEGARLVLNVGSILKSCLACGFWLEDLKLK